MDPRIVTFSAAGVTSRARLAVDPTRPGRRPGVVILHAFRGQGPLEVAVAQALAGHGFAALAADLYGEGRLAQDTAEARALMAPLATDRRLLRERLAATVDALKDQPEVDPERVGVMGFCFGGMCALEAARADLDVRAAVSVHGLFHPSSEPTAAAIRAKVLVLHGFDDPMARPDAAVALARELTAAGADWQMHMFGGAMHAFTNPGANDPAAGTVYHAPSHRRAEKAWTDFFVETLL